MLSIKTLKSGNGDRAKYYTQDEFLNQPSSGKDVSRLFQKTWFGRGAKNLNLSGQVAREDFENLISGMTPNGQNRIRGQRTRFQERLAEDLTFSAPKSISITLHLKEDLRLFEAHTKAVLATLEELEKRYAQTRRQRNQERKIINTNNLVVALIPHHLSRSGDMNLHTHAVVMNGTRSLDGQWRSLSNTGMSTQKWLGSYYKQELARNVRQIGYSIYETQDGFELEGITKEQIEVFSKRAKSIVAKIRARGLEVTPEARDEMVLKTRPGKRALNLEELRVKWQTEARQNQIEPPRPQKNPVTFQEQKKVDEVLNNTILQLASSSFAFRVEDIYRSVFARLRNFSLAELDREIKEHQKLIELENGKLTTAEASAREEKVIQQWMEGKNNVSPLISDSQSLETSLNSGQAQVLRQTMTCSDSFQIILGLSERGKLGFLAELQQQLKESEIKVRGFAPTVEAAQKLNYELDIETETIESVINNDSVGGSDELWIVEEASSINARQLEEIGNLVREKALRAIFLEGDKKVFYQQNTSPIKSLIDNQEVTTHHLVESIKHQESLSLSKNPNQFATISRLVPIQISSEDNDLSSYQVGNYIRVNRDYQSLALKKGDFYRIEGLKGDSLRVSSSGGRIYALDPSRYKAKQIFELQKMKLFLGDSLRLNTGVGNLNYSQGKKLKVISISSSEITLRDSRGKQRSVSLSELLPVELVAEKEPTLEAKFIQSHSEEQKLDTEVIELEVEEIVSKENHNSLFFENRYQELSSVVKGEKGILSPQRLDLEIYQRLAVEPEAQKFQILQNSPRYRQLESKDSLLSQKYFQAISSVSDVYQQISGTKSPHLNRIATQLVEQRLASSIVEQSQQQQETISISAQPRARSL